MKTLASTIACVALALAAGCAGVERPATPPPAAFATPEAAAPVAAAKPATAPSAPAAIPSETSAEAATSSGAAHAGSVGGRPQPAAAPDVVAVPSTAPKTGVDSKTVAKAAAPAARVTPAVTPQPAKTASAPAVTAAKPAAAPPLDLKSLEARLRETSAVGVMTKLTLKNQVDDLLDQFRAFYQGKLKTTLAQLRQSYDRLVMKVLALLQDADPPLANAIASSREAIWGILADPVKFAAV
jgi:hypothetical protein